MPVFNYEQYLQAAIESVLNQTFKNFEFLIISEHGTSEESLGIISRYQDHRIRHIHNSRRLGLVGSLNVGIAEASGTYIARFDADDFNLATRFEKQVNFLSAHPKVGVLGSRYDVMDREGKVIWRPKATTDVNLVKWRMILGECAVAHPSVMVRTEIYRRLGGYKPSALHVEDYELWTRAIEITQIANLSDTLLRLRAHSLSTSHAHEADQLARTLSIAERKLTEKFGKQVPQHYLDIVMLHRLRDEQETFAAASWMFDRCKEYITKEDMPRKGQKAIRAYTARKLYPVALICLKKWPHTSVKICRLIFELDPVGSTRLWMDLLTRIAKYPLKSVLRSTSPTHA